ncbi:MAG: hydroxyacid dehydrogenase [Anaerolineae bacterium]|nr:hydroxyacid dehydrogenase [Anaerolineae bacterium]
MSEKPVVILDPHFRRMDEIFSSEDHARLFEIAEVIWGKDDPMPDDEFLNALPNAEAIICTTWRYGNVLPQAKKLRAIFSVEGAFPLTLDHDYCFAHNIRVLSIAPTFARQVAEMSLGMAISACREISLGDRTFRQGNEKYLHAGNENTFMLYNKTVGFIGYGSIARELQRLITPFNVSLSAYDPWLTDSFIKSMGVSPMKLEDLLESSRFIFVLAAPTVENRALLSRAYLESIQQDAVVILMSRAHVVDFDALTDLVLEGRFRLATDVLPTEPLPANHPMRQAEKAILSAHRAGSVKEGLWEIGQFVVDDLESILRGLPPQRLPVLQPELSRRYAPIVVPTPDEA